MLNQWRYKGDSVLSGSISENRISVSMEPPVLEWLMFESRFFGTSVPSVVRMKLRTMWEDLPRDWKEQLRK